MRTAVALSGGIDSLCSLLLLMRAGHDVFAIHGQFLPESFQPPAYAATLARLNDTCEKLHVELKIIDFSQIFSSRIIGRFCSDYGDGKTPNPCAICNREMKFGKLLEAALAMGADQLATGHYARLARNHYIENGMPLLARAQDSAKDQSYFLALVPGERLQKAAFPLCDLSKSACRRIVAEHGLEAPQKQESQDICFLPGGLAYQDFLMEFWQSRKQSMPRGGPIFLKSKISAPEKDSGDSLIQVGTHHGLWRFTEGQRRGIGITGEEPLYVLAKNRDANALVIGGGQLLGMKSCIVENINLFVEPGLWPRELFVKLRYRQPLLPANILAHDCGLKICLKDRHFPTAAGQVAAIYDNAGAILAGGIVKEVS